ncbi:hypothetical protein [Lysobacter enzymogenes]|uniref:Outer membrane protein beta-barrel domain-containing protein n=1 Tax=Lysobacter enzymogenes TaxID=69 RepID=A0A188XLX6_LYSEN|nr:hypothetical protein [Lysobacter enzymogenes]ALH06621.1 hypothetical protein OH11GL002552 [Lysobacter enzymogenes]
MTNRFLPLTLALLGASAAYALPAHAEDDRFTIRLGAMSVDTSGEFTAGTTFRGNPYEFSQDFDFGSKETVPRLEGLFKFGDRHRLLFNYWGYDKSKTARLTQDVSFDDTTIPAGSFARAKTKFELASAMYDYAVVETDTVSWGLQIGVEYAKIEAKLRAQAGTANYSDGRSEDGYAPVVGSRLTLSPNEHWRFVVQGQYLDAGWGDFGDYKGDISRANALAEYRFTENVGVFVGYDWFKINAKRSRDNIDIGLDQRFKGPMAGVTFSF